MFKPKALTDDAVTQLTQVAWLTTGWEGEFRDALSRRDFERALDCCRHRRVDDLVDGALSEETPADVTGYTPRYALFGELSDYLTDDEYFPLAGHVWVEIDDKCVPPEVAEQLLRPANRDPTKGRMMMNEEELDVFDNLPADFDVFRGCTRDTADNCPWSRCREVAQHFAEDFAAPIIDPMSTEDQTPVVYKGRCSKQHVLAVFTRLGEEEIAVNPRHLRQRTEIWSGNVGSP